MLNSKIFTPSPSLGTSRMEEAGSSDVKNQDDKQLRRVRNLGESEKKRQRRAPRILRKGYTDNQRGNHAKLLNAYQLKAMKQWFGYLKIMDSMARTGPVENFVMGHVAYAPYLFPGALVNRLKKGKFSGFFSDEGSSLFGDGEVINDIVAKDEYLDGLLSLMSICRELDEKRKKRKQRKEKRGLFYGRKGMEQESGTAGQGRQRA